MNQIKKIALLLATASLFSISPAMASGSGGGAGGGGGGFSGGISAPAYNPVIDYQDGLKFLQAGEYKNADRKFNKVLKATNRNAPANYYMGLAKTGQEKYKSSIRYYKNATRYDKDLFEAHGGLGAAYALTGKTEKANKIMATLTQSLADCGSCAQAPRIKAAQDQITTALNGEATKTSYLAPINSGAAETQYFASVSLINQGEYKAAFDDLNKTMAVVGPHPDVTTYLGYTQRKLGNFDVAKGYYAMALEVDPSHKGANEYLGELYVETGEIDKAQAQLAKLEAICTFGCIEENELRGWLVNALP